MAAASSFIPTLSVALGGAAGAAARYQLGRVMTRWMGADAVAIFPWTTLAANALGSLLMGVLAGLLIRSGGIGAMGGDQARLLLGVGLLGGFTTFSAFSLECVMLIERGQSLLALTYILVSVALGIAALFFGLTVIRVTA